MSGANRKPGLRQRLGFLRRRGFRYSFVLLARKLGKQRVTHRLGGSVFTLTTDDAALALLRDDESWMIPLLKRVLPLTQGAFLDVGVNVGQSLLRLKAVEPARPWIGFEPNPECCKAVRRLIELNDPAPAKLHEFGLSDRTTTARLHVGSATDARGTTVEKFHDNLPDGMRTIEVELKDGRELIGGELAQRAGFIKIDVEGAESDVLTGLAPVIERDRPLVLLEILWIESADPEVERVRETRQQRTFNFFREHDYRVLRVRQAGRLEEFGEIHKPLPLDKCNYLAFPTELEHALTPG